MDGLWAILDMCDPIAKAKILTHLQLTHLPQGVPHSHHTYKMGGRAMEPLAKAEILIEALPYIRSFQGKLLL